MKNAEMYQSIRLCRKTLTKSIKLPKTALESNLLYTITKEFSHTNFHIDSCDDANFETCSIFCLNSLDINTKRV